MKDFLNDASVRTLTWPGNSPDLNPIENCWFMIGRKITDKKPRSLRELQETIVHVWHHEMNLDYIRKLIDSMPARVEAVIKAKGGPTKY